MYAVQMHLFGLMKQTMCVSPCFWRCDTVTLFLPPICLQDKQLQNIEDLNSQALENAWRFFRDDRTQGRCQNQMLIRMCCICMRTYVHACVCSVGEQTVWLCPLTYIVLCTLTGIHQNGHQQKGATDRLQNGMVPSGGFETSSPSRSRQHEEDVVEPGTLVQVCCLGNRYNDNMFILYVRIIQCCSVLLLLFEQ